MHRRAAPTTSLWSALRVRAPRVVARPAPARPLRPLRTRSWRAPSAGQTREARRSAADGTANAQSSPAARAGYLPSSTTELARSRPHNSLGGAGRVDLQALPAQHAVGEPPPDSALTALSFAPIAVVAQVRPSAASLPRRSATHSPHSHASTERSTSACRSHSTPHSVRAEWTWLKKRRQCPQRTFTGDRTTRSDPALHAPSRVPDPPEKAAPPRPPSLRDHVAALTALRWRRAASS